VKGERREWKCGRIGAVAGYRLLSGRGSAVWSLASVMRKDCMLNFGVPVTEEILPADVQSSLKADQK
jgi:hypothetical protein